MQPVVIYTSMLCPYCHRAKGLLKSKDVAFREIDVTMDPKGRAAMTQKAGGRTSVPQIFIGDTHVGGSDDLAALEAKGGLDDLLSGAA